MRLARNFNDIFGERQALICCFYEPCVFADLMVKENLLKCVNANVKIR